MEKHKWSKFALIEDWRRAPLPTECATEYVKPVWEEAQEHLQSVYDCVTSTLATVRQYCREIAAKMRADPRIERCSLTRQMSDALESVAKVASEFMTQMMDLIVMNNENKCGTFCSVYIFAMATVCYHVVFQGSV